MSDQIVLFQGYEVQREVVSIPGLGDLPLHLLFDGKEVAMGDEFEATVRFKLAAPNHPNKFDSDGNLKGQFTTSYAACALHDGFKITAYVTKAEAGAAWDKAHGAETA